MCQALISLALEKSKVLKLWRIYGVILCFPGNLIIGHLHQVNFNYG